MHGDDDDDDARNVALCEKRCRLMQFALVRRQVNGLSLCGETTTACCVSLSPRSRSARLAIPVLSVPTVPCLADVVPALCQCMLPRLMHRKRPDRPTESGARRQARQGWVCVSACIAHIRLRVQDAVRRAPSGGKQSSTEEIGIRKRRARGAGKVPCYAMLCHSTQLPLSTSRTAQAALPCMLPATAKVLASVSRCSSCCVFPLAHFNTYSLSLHPSLAH